MQPLDLQADEDDEDEESNGRACVHILRKAAKSLE